MNAPGDGYLRLTVDELMSVDFSHLISGLDDEHQAAWLCGGRTTISGYTEWIGKTDPALTVGWDWIVEPHRGSPWWRRVGLPRTNVLLVGASSHDYDWQRSLAVLGTIVDVLSWQEETSSAVADRYANRKREKSTCRGF